MMSMDLCSCAGKPCKTMDADLVARQFIILPYTTVLSDI